MASINEIFSSSRAQRDIANAGTDVATAKQAVSDTQAASGQQTAAIRSRGSNRTTGGGQYGTITSGRRGTITLGGAFGGLATANRNALNKTQKGANDVTMNATRRASVQDTYGYTADQADAALSPKGYINNGQRTTIDDTGLAHSTPI